MDRDRTPKTPIIIILGALVLLLVRAIPIPRAKQRANTEIIADINGLKRRAFSAPNSILKSVSDSISGLSKVIISINIHLLWVYSISSLSRYMPPKPESIPVLISNESPTLSQKS